MLMCMVLLIHTHTHSHIRPLSLQPNVKMTLSIWTNTKLLTHSFTLSGTRSDNLLLNSQHSRSSEPTVSQDYNPEIRAALSRIHERIHRWLCILLTRLSFWSEEPQPQFHPCFLLSDTCHFPILSGSWGYQCVPSYSLRTTRKQLAQRDTITLEYNSHSNKCYCILKRHYFLPFIS